MPPPSPGQHAVVVQHVAFEDLGSFEPVLRERGWTIETLQAGVDDLSGSLADAALAIVLGGPIGVYETALYPFLGAEVDALSRRLARNLPTLGICLGSQLVAKALGAAVYPGGRKEIGWSSLTLTEAGRASPLRHLDTTPVLHWHGDTFDLPPHCEHLASTAVYAHQAFRRGPNLLALQCHPEVQALTLERWLIGHTAELQAAGLDIPGLRQASARLAPPLEARASAMLDQWLEELSPP